MPEERPAPSASPALRRPQVLVLLGHPRGLDSFCGALASAFAKGARGRGVAVEFFDLSTCAFDPHVRLASPCDMPLEPDLVRLSQAIEAADHLVFVYPNWWGTMPALLKGALDRVLRPGWAFVETTGGIGFEGRLQPRTAELLTTMDTPGWAYRLIYGAPGHRAMARATLGFCGVETTRISRFGVVKGASEQERQRWLRHAGELGASLERRVRPHGHALARSATAWAKALRLQFYPMTFLAYAVGALAAVRGGEATWNASAFWLVYLTLFLLEAATVFINEIFDRESDLRNSNHGPFTGGSRVLVTKELSRRALGIGAELALSLAAIVLLVAVILAQPPSVGGLAAIGVLTVLALGYTLPPLKLSHRGLGELDVAVTHSLCVIYVGYLFQGGPLQDPFPLWLGLPLLVAVLPAITLSGVPDYGADRAAGKRTLVVKLGCRGALLLAACAVVLAALLALWVRHGQGILHLAGLDLLASLHAGVLLWLMWRQRERVAKGERIDGLMAASLLYIVWFAAVPLFHLS